MICEKCKKDKPNCAPFTDGAGKRWEKMCGGCKVRAVMTDPRRRQNLEDFGRKLGANLQIKTNNVK